MKRFIYTTRNQNAQQTRGELIAEDREEALKLLQQTGVYVTSLELVERPASFSKDRFFPVSIPEAQKLFLLESWALLLQAGFGMQSALLRLRRTVRHRGLSSILEKIQREMGQGTTLSEALATSQMFPSSWVSVLSIGEQRGDLIGPLQNMRRQILAAQRLRKEMFQMMLMPCFLLAGTLVWFWVFLHSVVPTLLTFSTEMGVPNPIAESLSGASSFLSILTRCLTIGFGVVVLVGIRMARSNQVMGTFQSWIPATWPAVGPLVSALHLHVVASELRLQLEAGIPLITAVYTLCLGVPNRKVRHELFNLYGKLHSGVPVDEALTSLSFIPADQKLLLISGNLSGRLPEMLAVLVREAEEEVQHRAFRLVVALRTGIVFACGVMVGLLAAAFFSLWITSISKITVVSPSLADPTLTL